MGFKFEGPILCYYLKVWARYNVRCLDVRAVNLLFDFPFSFSIFYQHDRWAVVELDKLQMILITHMKLVAYLFVEDPFAESEVES
jgi:hypothetical protein